MISGRVEGIYIAEKRGAPTVSVETVHLIPGMGIKGDRYFNSRQDPDINQKPGREITLIEYETIEALCEENGITITPGQTRRNIVTRGMALNDLVGAIFQVGSVRLRGIRLCEPCQYLADRTDPRVLQAMTNRGGLRAEILTEGFIHLNDLITYETKEQQ